MSDKPIISYDDFAKLDLRVGTVLAAEPHPNADRLLKLQIDMGGEHRQVLAGIRAFYQPADLVGKQVVVVANLAPRMIRGLESRGMVLAASVVDPPAPVPGPEALPGAAAATTGDAGAAAPVAVPAAKPPAEVVREIVVLSVQKAVPAGAKVS